MGITTSVTKNLTAIRRRVIKMERKWIMGIFLIVVTVVVSTGFLLHYASIPGAETGKSLTLSDDGGDIAGSLSHQIDMKSPMPTSPGTILVYKTNPPIVNKETTLALAKKFNVTGTMRGDQVVQSDDLVYGVEISKISGKMRYSNAKRPNDAMDAPGMLPSDEEAVRIATQFLKEKDLLPNGAELGRAKRGYTVFIDNNGNEIPRNGEVTVGFGRKLNNLDVKGAGVSVTLGGNGDIIEYSADWRNYTPYKEYPIKSPETAFGELKKKGMKTGIEKPGPVSIDSVYLAYTSKAPAFKEEYLEPVWIFKGQTMTKDSKVKPVTEYIPALKETPKEFISGFATAEATAIPTANVRTFSETVIPTTATSPIAATPPALTASLNVTPSSTTGNSTAS